MQLAETYKYPCQNHCPGFEMTTFVVILITTTMNAGRYIFRQIADGLNQRQFDRIASNYDSKLDGWAISPWNHLLMIMFGQLDGCRSLRELNDVIMAHKARCKHLGFGEAPSLTTMSRANNIRDYRIFEEFAHYMVDRARSICIGHDDMFSDRGDFYAFDSTTIDLCLRLYEWAVFRKTKSGIKVHTQIDVVNMIPVMFHITNAKVHDVNAMDLIEYEPNACYIFDRGYWDLSRLFSIDKKHSFFVIREKKHPEILIESCVENCDEENGVLADQTVRFATERNAAHYPSTIRRIVYYSSELKRTFVYYTNNFYLSAYEIACLYRRRWVVELFFKWIKQHLRVTTFWGQSENAVRIQVYVAIITYCLICIIRQQNGCARNPYEIIRVLGSSLLVKDSLVNLLAGKMEEEPAEDLQLRLDLGF